MYLLWNICTLFIILNLCRSGLTKGIVSLDSYTFDKVKNIFQINFIIIFLNKTIHLFKLMGMKFLVISFLKSYIRKSLL